MGMVKGDGRKIKVIKQHDEGKRRRWPLNHSSTECRHSKNFDPVTGRAEQCVPGARPNVECQSKFQPQASRGVGANPIFYLISCVSAALNKGPCDIALEMSSDSSRSVPSAVQADMEEIAQNIQILPERTLREIAKGPLVKFTLSCDDTE